MCLSTSWKEEAKSSLGNIDIISLQRTTWAGLLHNLFSHAPHPPIFRTAVTVTQISFSSSWLAVFTYLPGQSSHFPQLCLYSSWSQIPYSVGKPSLFVQTSQKSRVAYAATYWTFPLDTHLRPHMSQTHPWSCLPQPLFSEMCPPD